MNEFEPYNQSHNIEKKQKKNRLFTIFTTITSGVIGAVLTLAFVANTSILEGPVVEVNNQPVSQKENPNYNVEKTGSKQETDSLADVVENTSKTVVGVINYQQQMNRFAANSELSESGTGSGVIYYT